MTAPVRLQLSRAKGYRLQASSQALNGLAAMLVARPSSWGNAYPVAKMTTAIATAWDWGDLGGQRGDARWNAFFRDRDTDARVRQAFEEAGQLMAVHAFEIEMDRFARVDPQGFEAWLAPLRGHNLACWCKPGTPCHADVLLRLANAIPGG